MEYNEKNTIKKLLQDTLSEEEKMRLTEGDVVSSYMRKQWDSKEEKTDDLVGNCIWKNIRQSIWGYSILKQISFYKKISIAASILLILGIGCSSYFLYYTFHQPLMYVVNTGIQNIYHVTLPDGTSVEMGPRSTLIYPEQFKDDNRTVELKGQGFFKVAKNKK
ncbi:MAG: FecR domain-containing protein, partial [Bacteroides sp.]